MDKHEIRLRLIDLATKNALNGDGAVAVAKTYESYVTAGDEADKDNTPVDTVKGRQKGSTVSTKKVPRK
jgi:hypothetical protein